MSLWNSSSIPGITSIYQGNENSGNGDSIYIAFEKVIQSFANVNLFLYQGAVSNQSIEFVNANVDGALIANSITSNSSVVAIGPVVLAKMTRTQLTSGNANVTAAVAYDTTANCPVYFNGTNWLFFSNNNVI
jgi:hypothetical protein